MLTFTDRSAGVLERARDVVSRLDRSNAQSVDTVRALADEARRWLDGLARNTSGSSERAQQALADGVDAAAEALSGARSRARTGLRDANSSVRDAAGKMRDVAYQGRDWLGEHPVQTLLIAGAAGFLLAMLLSGGGDDDDRRDRSAGW